MKVTALDGSVLSTQGGVGSYSLGVPNPAPGVGPMAGDAAAANGIASSEIVAAIHAPDQYGSATNGAPSNEPDSQYDTIDPIPQG